MMKQRSVAWCLVLACVASGSSARADYPVRRIEGVVSFVNAARSGVRMKVDSQERAVELGYASSVRLYEPGLAAGALKVGDEVCLWQKGRARVAIDNLSVGRVTSLAPLRLRAASSRFWPVGTTRLGDYASVRISPLQTHYSPSVIHTPRGDIVVDQMAPPEREKVWTILKPERVEFTRLSQRALTDLKPGQRVSMYVAQIPPARLRSRGIAILKLNSSGQP